MPPTKRSAAFTAAAPTAKQAVAYLKRNGKPELAAAVAAVLAYGTEAAESSARAAERAAETNTPNQSLYLHKAFKDHVKAEAAKQGVEIPDLIKEGFARYLAGQWAPKPRGRASKGSAGNPASLNVRIPADLWDDVDDKARKYAEEVRKDTGQKVELNARKVAVQILEERFPTVPATE